MHRHTVRPCQRTAGAAPRAEGAAFGPGNGCRGVLQLAFFVFLAHAEVISSDYALLARTIAKITESLGRPVKIAAKLNPLHNLSPAQFEDHHARQRVKTA
jgi:hypothetical protein